MADAALLALVSDRLDAHPATDGVDALVLSAFQGADALAATLAGEPVVAVVSSDGARPQSGAAYLTAIEVEGFRGVGPAVTLGIDPGPGLTLVVGRNGSGKSSFAEALEMLLIGTNQRWKDRTRVWQDGWQNLHHRHTAISARFTVDGRREPLTIARRWTDNAGLDESTLTVDGKPRTLDGLGWTQALNANRPLLSHHELEGALDAGPSKLYDALADILGLDELTAAQETLRRKRLALEHDTGAAKDAAATLRQLLEQTDDERATIVLQALKPKTWNLDVIAQVVSGMAGADEQGVLRRLRNLAGLPVIDRERLTDAADALRTAHAALERQRETDAARADETAHLLQQALDVHTHAEGETCPVCGTESVLTYEWRLRTVQRIEELRGEAEAVHAARRQLATATSLATQLVTAVPAALSEAGDVGVDTKPAQAAWQRWVELPDVHDELKLAAHLEAHGLPLIDAVARLRSAAAKELERRERAWRPAAESIIAWLPLARAARDAEARIKRLKEAEAWLKAAHDEVRDDRFRPIADAVQQNWTELRQDSNVTLGELRLAGASTQRRLTLDVSVDGEPGSALGVMSQGELNCLALSLFLPRASMPESPFRFVVIDDPVQAMDPAKVEGLARVLARAAHDRQVIVLTHDTRLADAVRFLDIRATVIEVVRREHSVVELRRVGDPVQRYLDDAFAVALTEGVPPEAMRVIPGFCRMALEAACSLAVTRRLLRTGTSYAAAQEQLAQPTTLLMWLALALLKDASRSGDVYEHLKRQHPQAADPVRDCNRGAHEGWQPRDPKGFIRDIERLSKAITGDAAS